MEPVDTTPVIGGKSREYKCRKTHNIPETGTKLEIPCFYNGTFEVLLFHMLTTLDALTFILPFQHEPLFPASNYPKCIDACVDFPTIEGMRPTSKLPLLPGRTIDYYCEDSSLVPHTNKNHTMRCLTNGTFVAHNNDTAPACVPKNTCRLPWPSRSEYRVEPTR